MRLATILANKGGTVLTIHPDASVTGLLAMLAEHHVGALVVSDDERHVHGIVSERDVVRALASGTSALDAPVSSIMSTEVFCASPEASVDELAALMTNERIRHVPITDEDDLLVGLVSIGDVVKSRLGELEVETTALVGYITHGR